MVRTNFARGRPWWRRWPGLLALALILGVGAWGLWGRRPPPPPPPPPAEKPTATMETLSLTEIQEGGKRWVLEGQKADFHKDRNEISIMGVKVEFFREQGDQVKLKAQEGLLNTKTKVLTLKGQVELESGDTVIKTSIFVYQPEGRLLLAPEDVVMENPRVRVEGKGLRVELAVQKLALTHHKLTVVKGGAWKPSS